MWARNGRWILPEMPDFQVAFRNLLHAANLRHWTDGFTSPPKEGVLKISSPLKIRRLRAGLNPRTWVLKASTLPLDHRSRYDIKIVYSTSSVNGKLLKTSCKLWLSVRPAFLPGDITYFRQIRQPAFWWVPGGPHHCLAHEIPVTFLKNVMGGKQHTSAADRSSSDSHGRTHTVNVLASEVVQNHLHSKTQSHAHYPQPDISKTNVTLGNQFKLIKKICNIYIYIYI